VEKNTHTHARTHVHTQIRIHARISTIHADITQPRSHAHALVRTVLIVSNQYDISLGSTCVSINLFGHWTFKI